METLNKKKKFFHMPHTYALIIGFIILAYLLTFVIPSGAYDRVTNPQTGVEMVDPDTYHKLDVKHLSPFQVALAIPQGLEQAGYIIFFIFIIAGAFQVVTATGAIEAGIKKLAILLQGKEILAIVIFTIAFSIGGATIGMSQETVIFIPIAIMLARSLGYDAMVGFAIVSLGAQVGFHSGWLNPFTVAVAQDIAELPLFSAIGMRFVFWIVYLIATIWFIMRYARKVKKDPSKSIVYQLELDESDQKLEDLPEGYQVPEGREKPWGTAHAVLSCREKIDGPFAVINADDYYGPGGFQSIYDFLIHNEDGETYSYCMVGFRLENTITENGHVARGVCEIAEDGNLTQVTERTKIMRRSEGIAYTEDDGETWNILPADTTVSMNFWGFTQSMMKEMQARFPVFLEQAMEENPLKGEFYLPAVADQLIKEEKATVKVLPTQDKWYGVTYRADKEMVMGALQSMKDKGLYPEKLWK